MHVQEFIFEESLVEAVKYEPGEGREVAIWGKGSFAEVKNYGDKQRVIREWVIVGEDKSIAHPGDWVVKGEEAIFVIPQSDESSLMAPEPPTEGAIFVDIEEAPESLDDEEEETYL